MRIVITGGRDNLDATTFIRVMKRICPEYCVLGDCPTGVDRMALNYCEDNDIKYNIHFADWDQHGKSAGPIRNGVMLREPDIDFVLAFRGGRGTENCVKQAKEKGLLVLRVE